MTVTERWEQGVAHDPRSVELIKALAIIDRENGFPLDIEIGGDGDGDSGETLMFLLDIYFTESPKRSEG